MKNWIDIVRDVNYFNLIVTNQKKKLGRGNVQVSMPCRKDKITAMYDEVYHVNTVASGFDGVPPDFIGGSDVHSYANNASTKANIIAHAEDPAAAQRAGNIGLFWGNTSYDFTDSTRSDRILSAYREDDFPAIIIMINISKHYHHGQLHRKRKLPAISADYIGALWYQEPGQHVRRNGPACILLENYKEYWEEGEFKGHRWSNYNLSWGWRDEVLDETALEKFLGNLQGTTDMFANSFFTDVQDEVCFITDFA